MIKTRETSRRNGEGPSSITSTSPLHTWRVGKQRHGSQSAKRRIEDKSYLVTVYIGASVTIARPDTTAGLSVRDLITPYVLQMASREILPILKEALVKLTLGQCPLTTWVFIASITDKFILRLGLACQPCICGFGAPHAMSGCQSYVEVPLWCPRARLHLSPCVNRSSKVVVIWCGRVIVVQLEGTLEAADRFVGTDFRAAHRSGVCRVRMPVQPPR